IRLHEVASRAAVHMDVDEARQDPAAAPVDPLRAAGTRRNGIAHAARGFNSAVLQPDPSRALAVAVEPGHEPHVADQPFPVRHSPSPAALSSMTTTRGGGCGRDAGHAVVTGPFSARRTASALLLPLATRRIVRAFGMLPTPIVTARFGTSSGRSKKRAFACRVASASSTTWTPDASSGAGSLKA